MKKVKGYKGDLRNELLIEIESIKDFYKSSVKEIEAINKPVLETLGDIMDNYVEVRFNLHTV